MNLTDDSDMHPILIALLVAAVVIYFWGVYFHVRIIQVSKKDKDITWKLDIANSIMMLFIFFQAILMHGITYIIIDLYTFTGQWFCYVFKVISTYSNIYLGGHALVISLTKYSIIIHWQKAREWGNEKVAMLYFWINIMHPVISILIWLCIRSDFFWAYDGMAQIDRCLGDPKDVWVENFEKLAENKSLTKLHNLCHMIGPLPQDYIQYIIHAIRACICWLHVGFFYGSTSNILEMAVYYQIFAFMHRYVQYIIHVIRACIFHKLATYK